MRIVLGSTARAHSWTALDGECGEALRRLQRAAFQIIAAEGWFCFVCFLRGGPQKS